MEVEKGGGGGRGGGRSSDYRDKGIMMLFLLMMMITWIITIFLIYPHTNACKRRIFSGKGGIVCLFQFSLYRV